VFVPTPRTGYTLVYDDKRQRVVLFGGRVRVAGQGAMTGGRARGAYPAVTARPH
jgi:hypothetical protein